MNLFKVPEMVRFETIEANVDSNRSDIQKIKKEIENMKEDIEVVIRMARSLSEKSDEEQLNKENEAFRLGLFVGVVIGVLGTVAGIGIAMII